MTRAKLQLAIITGMLGALSLQCSAPLGADGQLVGQPAPTFELRDLEGHRVSLDQLRGKIVMLDFWATWCGPCQISMPIMDRLQKEFSSDVVLLAINVMEPEETVREYVSRQNLRSKVLLDLEGNVGEEYGSDAIPMQVIIDRHGVVQRVNVGLGPRMEASLREEINRLRTNCSGPADSHPDYGLSRVLWVTTRMKMAVGVPAGAALCGRPSRHADGHFHSRCDPKDHGKAVVRMRIG